MLATLPAAPPGLLIRQCSAHGRLAVCLRERRGSFLFLSNYYAFCFFIFVAPSRTATITWNGSGDSGSLGSSVVEEVAL